MRQISLVLLLASCGKPDAKRSADIPFEDTEDTAEPVFEVRVWDEEAKAVNCKIGDISPLLDAAITDDVEGTNGITWSKCAASIGIHITSDRPCTAEDTHFSDK